MTTLTLIAGIALLGATPAANDYGPEGKTIKAQNGKAVCAGLATVEYVGMADPLNPNLKPWDSEGNTLGAEAAARFKEMVAKGKFPQQKPQAGYVMRVVAVKTKLEPNVGYAAFHVDQPSRQMSSSGSDLAEVHYVSVPKHTRTIGAQSAYFKTGDPWKTVAWCKLDGQSTLKGASLKLAQSYPSEGGAASIGLNCIVPDFGNLRIWQVAECKIDAFPADAEWFPAIKPGVNHRVTNISMRVIIPEAERGAKLETKPRTAVRFKLATNPKW